MQTKAFLPVRSSPEVHGYECLRGMLLYVATSRFAVLATSEAEITLGILTVDPVEGLLRVVESKILDNR